MLIVERDGRVYVCVCVCMCVCACVCIYVYDTACPCVLDVFLDLRVCGIVVQPGVSVIDKAALAVEFAGFLRLVKSSPDLAGLLMRDFIREFHTTL